MDVWTDRQTDKTDG